MAWDAPREAVRDYRIRWAKVGENYRTWTDLNFNAFPTAPSYTIEGLEAGARYKVLVRARFNVGSGPWAAEVRAEVMAPVPPSDTPIPPSETPIPPSETPVPPSDTPIPPSDTPIPPSDTPIPPSDTPVPPSDTPVPPSDTPIPPTDYAGSAERHSSAAERHAGSAE